jgi:hypothetical protein
LFRVVAERELAAIKIARVPGRMEWICEPTQA